MSEGLRFPTDGSVILLDEDEEYSLYLYWPHPVRERRAAMRGAHTYSFLPSDNQAVPTAYIEPETVVPPTSATTSHSRPQRRELAVVRRGWMLVHRTLQKVKGRFSRLMARDDSAKAEQSGIAG